VEFEGFEAEVIRVLVGFSKSGEFMIELERLFVVEVSGFNEMVETGGV
jgi:hypothetical protein